MLFERSAHLGNPGFDNGKTAVPRLAVSNNTNCGESYTRKRHFHDSDVIIDTPSRYRPHWYAAHVLALA
jgi:hypothetical protein